MGPQKQKDDGHIDFLDELEDLNNDNILYNEALIGRQLDNHDTMLKTRAGFDNLPA